MKNELQMEGKHSTAHFLKRTKKLLENIIFCELEGAQSILVCHWETKMTSGKVVSATSGATSEPSPHEFYSYSFL